MGCMCSHEVLCAHMDSTIEWINALKGFLTRVV